MAHQTLFRSEEVSNIKMVSGDGIYLLDEKGKRYIDTAAGTFNLSLGYSNQEVIKAAFSQASHLLHCTSSFTTDPIDNLAIKLVETSPTNLKIAHTKVSSGSVAIEGAIKLAQYYTGKKEVICFHRSHHGQTIHTMAMSGFSFRNKPFQFSKDGIHHVPYPYYYRSPNKTLEQVDDEVLAYIENTVEYSSHDQISAIVMEPILGLGGNVIPSRQFLVNLRDYCNKKGIVLIFDEIQTGVGRTGFMYASEHFGVQPDIMAVSKGLGGTGFQISAILMEEKFNGMPADHHSFTYGSNLMSSAAAVKTLEIISQASFLENVQVQGLYINQRLNKMRDKYDFIGDVRGVGLMIGVEVVKDKASREPDVSLTNRIKKVALAHGLIVRTSGYGRGNVFKIRPSLNITGSESKEICDILDSVMAEIDSSL
ncbi:aspartate aminotransferase family protein [Okeania sp. KiyG1]|uniref:aspartate aminotransferase family protein n=1 Tax=Okeania sp. KiyG1 TaxID=2720165 RepID=UPI0019205C49|nr:aspartate aminotransferase family protein [Okeania sp. KiyG1]GGA32446.1 aspartate aminotransferase family protein [Okeania sp. KiyG1]